LRADLDVGVYISLMDIKRKKEDKSVNKEIKIVHLETLQVPLSQKKTLVAALVETQNAASTGVCGSL